MKVLDSTGLSYLVQKLKDMFSLTTHNHDTAYAAKTHTHTAADVTSGTLSSDRLPTVPVSKGGTGATSAATARSNLGITLANLGAAASSHNHSASNITSGTLPVARGGTGVTTSAAIGLKAYPVGAVYISYVSTSPASLFGGSWVAITGRFPYFNNGTSTGGSNSQTINFNHTHRQTDKFTSSYQTGGNGYQYTNGGTQTNAHVATADSAWSGGEGAGIGTKITLGNKTISTVPSYQTFYAWRRTA